MLVVDVVESVRLMEENEDDAVSRWRRIVEQVEHDVLPAHGGRLVKSLGDGLLLEFPRVPPAVSAAFAIQQTCNRANAGAFLISEVKYLIARDTLLSCNFDHRTPLPGALDPLLPTTHDRVPSA